MAIIIALQLAGNGLVIWLLLFKGKLTKPNMFILALAIADFVSGLLAPIGAYREDLGRKKFDLPVFLNFINVCGDMLTSVITWNVISFFVLIRVV